MYPLFETLCVQDGVIKNSSFHEARFKQAFYKFYGYVPNFNLLDAIEVPKPFNTGIVKLRIDYNQEQTAPKFTFYTPKIINTLKLVYDNHIDYDLKFTHRAPLTQLWQKRGNCDDVLICKNGLITDTYFANILFTKNAKWYTPKTFLLNGTCRQRLLQNKLVESMDISVHNLKKFEGFQLINAMLDFDPLKIIPIGQIKTN
ncbi:hypothetical protein BUL40_11205 [Croceivirga radicis]|uniref:4-amino-4-deoxychorismate lyase n=1 Tax=Croceivirga radicis TaxID=1929488 RepID=A0A1V6LQE4_9FLAO|nr:aminotransferase class IV [Croceivirga radicis]OQD42329.1 hypothetical protein BUL40_11205 [Croceivirga radicis]